MRAASSLVQVTGTNLTYVYVILAISLAALAIAWALRAQVLAADEGTEKMREIAGAVQEGAAAYLARQFRTLSYFVAIVFLLLFALPGTADIRIGRSIFFLIGASFSALVGTTECGWPCAPTSAWQRPPDRTPLRKRFGLPSAPAVWLA